MSIDVKRLVQDAHSTHAMRPKFAKAGSFAAVRAALPQIKALRADGVRWADIAEALAAQGITQGTGDASKPLTASRLTAIVGKLETADRRRANKQATRSGRPDLVRRSAEANASSEPLRLADELTVNMVGDSTARKNSGQGEDAIRRRKYAEVQALLRPEEQE